MPVNVVAPYVLIALLHRTQRLVYLSSSTHRGGRASLTGMDWSGHRTTGSYSDSKLFVTTLAIAVARPWTDVLSNAVNPGWVPTTAARERPDDRRLGHLTQKWLGTSDDPQARTSGGYWYQQRRAEVAPASTTGGSQTSCSRTWLASPTCVSSDPPRDGDVLPLGHGRPALLLAGRVNRTPIRTQAARNSSVRACSAPSG